MHGTHYEINRIAQVLMRESAHFRHAALHQLERLSGDASGRSYYRIHTLQAPVATAILMLASNPHPPLSPGIVNLSLEDTFMDVGRFLKKSGIPVPEIYAHDPQHSAFLVEDVGEISLYHAATQASSISAQRLFEKAAEIILKIQRLPANNGCLAFKKRFQHEQYLTEASRFVELYLKPEGLLQEYWPFILHELDLLSRAVAAHPPALTHRDFMPWNIFVREPDNLFVLDFQDALMASCLYDLVSLLHDRDIDYILGPHVYQEVYEYFKRELGFGSVFERWYLEVLCQRHFRLVGQFTLLSQKTGKSIYRSWVPGCLRRIGQALALMPDKQNLLNILRHSLPEIDAGAADPLKLGHK